MKKDYTCWGQRELIEELERRDKEHRELSIVCAYCNEPMYVIVKGHSHTENGIDVTS